MSMRVPLSILVFSAALAAPQPALAAPPVLASVTHQARHPVATFSAPRADSVTIYFASRPDRATDGSFLSENIKELDIMTDSEIQSGRWLDENRLDPGTYWVMLRASPDFDACYIFDSGTYDAACANGFSNLVMLTIEKPRVRYTVSATVYKSLAEATLRLRATPLGEKVPYRLCYPNKKRKTLCLAGTLNGYSWDSDAEDSRTVNTRSLASVTTFTWYVAGKKVASKRLRIR
jgi:hypothetical protein